MAAKQNKKNIKKPLDDIMEKVKKADLNSIFIFGAIILVLVVGLYAIFAPRTAEIVGGNPACGKIVIASDAASLRGNVSPTLAGAKYFLVVDPLTKKILEKVKNPYSAAATPGRELIYLIAGKGEEAVIVGDIDPQSYNILSQFGIKVFGGYTGKVKNVIGLYRQARVAPMSQTPQAVGGQNSVPNAGGFVGGQEMSPAAPVAFVPDINQGYGSFMCPQCRWQTNYSGMGGAAPMCPRCRMGMVGQNYPMGGMQNCPVGGMRAGQMGGMQYPQMGVMQNCPAGGMQNGMGFDQNAATPVAFGFGDQAFICPTCNWRMKCPRQGNAYPNCPNCGSAMAQDMAKQGFLGLNTGEIFAANTAPVQNYYQPAANMNQIPCPQNFYQPVANQQQIVSTPVQGNVNQMQAQPSFWQGSNSLGYFICPGCNWRMYSERPLGEYPRCPNCKQIMARSGLLDPNANNQFNPPTAMNMAVPQQYMPQTNVYQGPMGRNFGDQFGGRDIPRQNFAQQNTFSQPQAYQAPVAQAVAAQTPTGQTPPISRNAQMIHAYRGVCTNCHQIIDSPAAQPQGFAPNDPAGAQVAATCVLR